MSENLANDTPVTAASDPLYTGQSPIEPPEFGLGGQALIEGVMMRSPHFIAASVRLADGSIETRVEKFEPISRRHRWLGLPFIRGTVALVEMMFVGMRFLNWSAQKALEGEENGAPTSEVGAAEAAGAAQGLPGSSAVVVAEAIVEQPDTGEQR